MREALFRQDILIWAIRVAVRHARAERGALLGNGRGPDHLQAHQVTPLGLERSQERGERLEDEEQEVVFARLEKLPAVGEEHLLGDSVQRSVVEGGTRGGHPTDGKRRSARTGARGSVPRGARAAEAGASQKCSALFLLVVVLLLVVLWLVCVVLVLLLLVLLPLLMLLNLTCVVCVVGVVVGVDVAVVVMCCYCW